MSGIARPSAARAEGFLERAIKAWGRGSPDTPEEPNECTVVGKPCTIGRKFWFSDSGGGMVASIGGREKKKAEARLRACGALGANEEISGAVEAVSSDNSLEKLQEVFEGGLSEDRIVPVCSKKMYEVIADFGRGLGSDRTA
jgi:hypothetical protein